MKTCEKQIPASRSQFIIRLREAAAEKHHLIGRLDVHRRLRSLPVRSARIRHSNLAQPWLYLPAFASPAYEQQVGPQHALVSGFRARMNALATLPSTCGAI